MADLNFTPVDELGEFGLIEALSRLLPDPKDDIVVPLGDDAAAWRPEPDHIQLITTDSLIEHVHFDRTYTPMRHLGYKSVTVNLSDIAAMNGSPRLVVVGLGIPNNVSVEMVDALYRGIGEAAATYGISVAGGDVAASHKLVISVTAVGSCPEAAVVRRSGAEPGDLLFVTGTLGASVAGLRILQHHKQRLQEVGEDYEPDLSEHTYVIQRHLRPEARTDVIELFREADVHPKAMIDVSDGLASDVRHICRNSSCGAMLTAEAVLVDERTRAVAETLGDDEVEYALQGGEDYELVFAVSPGDRDRIEDMPLRMTLVGECRESSEGIVLERNGSEELLEPRGFRHF